MSFHIGVLFIFTQTSPKSVKLVKSYLYLKISLNKQIKGVIYGK